jgi:hypothetical protein
MWRVLFRPVAAQAVRLMLSGPGCGHYIVPAGSFGDGGSAASEHTTSTPGSYVDGGRVARLILVVAGRSVTTPVADRPGAIASLTAPAERSNGQRSSPSCQVHRQTRSPSQSANTQHPGASSSLTSVPPAAGAASIRSRLRPDPATRRDAIVGGASSSPESRPPLRQLLTKLTVKLLHNYLARRLDSQACA